MPPPSRKVEHLSGLKHDLMTRGIAKSGKGCEVRVVNVDGAIATKTSSLKGTEAMPR
jgi:hypothetical protein